MSKKIFKQNSNIILSHLKINWKLILFFMIFWLVISLTLLSITLTSNIEGTKTPYTGNVSVEIKTTHSSKGGNIISISQMLNWGLFASPGIVFFSIFTILLINKTLIKEINNGQITAWITLPLSRKQILSSKTLFIALSNIIVFLPSYILILIFVGISQDVSLWFGYVTLYGLQFILFIFLLIVIYTLISICLIEKTIVVNIINSLIAFWILATWVILIFYDSNPIEREKLKYFKYISLQSLIICPIEFSIELHPPITMNNHDSILSLAYNKHIEFNKTVISICTVSMPIITIATAFLNNYLFKNKNLNV